MRRNLACNHGLCNLRNPRVREKSPVTKAVVSTHMALCAGRSQGFEGSRKPLRWACIPRALAALTVSSELRRWNSPLHSVRELQVHPLMTMGEEPSAAN